MTSYIATKIRLTQAQLTKLNHGIRTEEEVTLQIKKSSVADSSGSMINLTRTQLNRLERLDGDRAARITLSKAQLKSMGTDREDRMSQTQKVAEKLLKLTLTPTDVEKIKRVRFNDTVDVREFEGNSIFSGVAKVVLPFIKNSLPKILGTLGLAGATGAISGAAHKATSKRGSGLKRVGGEVKVCKKDLEDMMKLGNFMEENNMVKKGFVSKMNKNVKQQKGGFIGTLIASLAGSLLPSLLSGKGLGRAGEAFKKS